MNTDLTVYVDMDGVIADFVTKFKEIAGKNFYDMSKGKAWSIIENYNRNVQPYFVSLPKMVDADELWQYVNSKFQTVQILTATGTTPLDVVNQKKIWIANNFGPDVVVNHVLRGPDKAAYATPNRILIDDKDYVIKAFMDSGGIGVLHTSAKNTIEQLEQLLKSK